MDWQKNIITSSAGIQSLLNETRSIAVLGIKTEGQANQPAFYVPRYLQTAGFQVIPVPVYYPDVTRILGQQVYRQLADIPIDVDLVNVFRLSHDVPPHVPDILAKMPKAVWCNPEFVTMRQQKHSQKPESKSFRTAASW